MLRSLDLRRSDALISALIDVERLLVCDGVFQRMSVIVDADVVHRLDIALQ